MEEIRGRIAQRVRYNNENYRLHQMQNGTSFWRCLKWKNGCRASISTRNFDGRTMAKKPCFSIVHNHYC